MKKDLSYITVISYFSSVDLLTLQTQRTHTIQTWSNDYEFGSNYNLAVYRVWECDPGLDRESSTSKVNSHHGSCAHVTRLQKGTTTPSIISFFFSLFSLFLNRSMVWMHDLCYKLRAGQVKQ